MSSKNNDRKIVIALIISLIAFGLGSGIGISVGMSGDDLNSSQDRKPVNATVDVTHNISQDNVYYNMDVNSYYGDSEDSEDMDSPNISNSAIYYSEEDLSNQTNQTNE